ncbi:putative ABC transporter periplasmic solute-binding protein [Methylobacterium sp. 4-46]|uniref:ABC transporter substrate-binding protein n=1 Tax=unclassified Methylobacterium TaxID=2615210 RepID=UPI000152D1BF|nr:MULTISPECIES: ABC transporter substrate-binding protein [Methylobacterium]ACA20036.1 putative ABC transporter periplasmic solute-binding protein [Methylobacterium sp. 4-46]WFT79223.1 transporter substrate-binding domain-containing protein [Methylobacterium nodulans]
MLSRRGFLAAAALWPLPLGAAEESALRVGVLPFGTVSWEAAVIKERRLDAALGFSLESLKLAGNDAARIAFQGDQVDTIVSDLLWAARLRAEGKPVKFLPYSSTEGALMVPAGSPIRAVADLAGKRIGVAGGALDKNWLLLKARAQEKDGIDLERAARPAFGAPPLLMQKLEAGELDAALLYWTFCARLEARGFRRLIGADEIARAFGIEGPIALLGYVFDEGLLRRKPAALAAFARASREAKQALAADDSAWASVRPLMAAEDEATFGALRRDFLAGIPRRPVAAERADAERLYAVLARLGGERLVGSATTLPEGLYWDAPHG